MDQLHVLYHFGHFISLTYSDHGNCIVRGCLNYEILTQLISIRITLQKKNRVRILFIVSFITLKSHDPTNIFEFKKGAISPVVFSENTV